MITFFYFFAIIYSIVNKKLILRSLGMSRYEKVGPSRPDISRGDISAGNLGPVSAVDNQGRSNSRNSRVVRAIVVLALLLGAGGAARLAMNSGSQSGHVESSVEIPESLDLNK